MKNDRSEFWFMVILWICLFLAAALLTFGTKLIFAPFIAIFQ